MNKVSKPSKPRKPTHPKRKVVPNKRPVHIEGFSTSVAKVLRIGLDNKRFCTETHPKFYGSDLRLSIDGPIACYGFLLRSTAPQPDADEEIQTIFGSRIDEDEYATIPFAWDAMKGGTLLDRMGFDQERGELRLLENDEKEDVEKLRKRGVPAYWTLEVSLGLMRKPVGMGKSNDTELNYFRKFRNREQAERYAKGLNLEYGVDEIELAIPTQLPLWLVKPSKEHPEGIAVISEPVYMKDGSVKHSTILDVACDAIFSYLESDELELMFLTHLDLKLTIRDKLINA